MSRLGILIVIGAILLLFFFVAISRISFRVVYSDGISVVARFLFLRIRLYPRPRKRPARRNFKTKRFKKWIKRNVDRADKKSERAKRKAERKKAKNNLKKQEGGEDQPQKKRGAKPLVRLFTRILKKFTDKFPRYLRTSVKRLVIGVSTDDAANTAIAYGYTVQAVQYLIELVRVKTDLREVKGAVVSVYPDFTADKCRVELDVTLGIRVWQVISLGLIALTEYLKKNVMSEKKQPSKEKNTVNENQNTGDDEPHPVCE